MRRFLRPLALLPIATALALFVHAFTGEDHDVAGGHGPELFAALGLGLLAWLTWLGVEAFQGRRAGVGIARSLAGALPGGGRLGVLAIVVALEAALAYAGIESSEGRLVAALHLDPLVAGGLFGFGGLGFAALARTLATWAARFGVAVAEESRPERLAASRATIARRRRLAYAYAPVRVHRGRAPPRSIPR